MLIGHNHGGLLVEKRGRKKEQRARGRDFGHLMYARGTLLHINHFAREDTAIDIPSQPFRLETATSISISLVPHSAIVIDRAGTRRTLPNNESSKSELPQKIVMKMASFQDLFPKFARRFFIFH